MKKDWHKNGTKLADSTPMTEKPECVKLIVSNTRTK